MSAIRIDELTSDRQQAQFLQRRWAELCAHHLPLVDRDSIWRYSRATTAGDIDQGWKLHVSATILNAAQILAQIAPMLIDCDVQFKAARSLDDVIHLNSGLFDAYCQIGKVITIYPRNNDEAVRLAERLHKLTYRFRTPSVPFDLRFCHGSNVYYRYGAFKQTQIEQNGERTPGVISANGELVRDLRHNPKPDWISDPFQAGGAPAKPRTPKVNNGSSFQVLRALTQRGKGGVYQAIDLQSKPPRLCLLKEGRRLGEVEWDGRDGAWRVRNEQRVLSRLSRQGIRVPQVYSRFEIDGNVYLAMEFVDGQSLHGFLRGRKRRLSLNRALSFGLEIATFLAQMHRAGWAWRDCKPANLIVSRKGRLVPIDFEGAEQVTRPDPMLWGTPGFIPRLSRPQTSHSGVTDDLYALGSILFLLVTGRMFDETGPVPISKLRHNVPFDLNLLIESLLSTDPEVQPSAQYTQTSLESILQKHSWKRLNLKTEKAA